MHSTLVLAALVASAQYAAAHLVFSYPGWRGDNLHDSGKDGYGNVPEDGLGVNWNGTDLVYPYGMQWAYPCGGMPTSQNRTKWGINGGAVSFQPGWFSGHKTAFIYINLGLGTTPPNMSHPMLPVFQIVGPSNNAYPGTFCLPQVPLPPNITVNVGDNATIQVVEAAIHGAALYSCVDITFANDVDVPPVNSSNCFNSSVGQGNGGPMGFNFVYTATGQAITSAAAALVRYSWTTVLLALTLSLFSTVL